MYWCDWKTLNDIVSVFSYTAVDRRL